MIEDLKQQLEELRAEQDAMMSREMSNTIWCEVPKDRKRAVGIIKQVTTDLYRARMSRNTLRRERDKLKAQVEKLTKVLEEVALESSATAWGLSAVLEGVKND